MNTPAEAAWKARELALYIDTIIEKLEAETHNYSGEVSMVLEQFITELRDIQMQYQHIAGYTTDVYAVSQLKNQFYMNVQRTVVQLEKLVRLVQTGFEQTHGDLYFIVKNVVADFLYAFRNIYTHVQYYGVYGEQSPRQLVLQIQESTSSLTGFFQGLTHFDAHRMYAIREYVQHVEAIMSRMQEIEGTYGNLEIDAIFQQIYGKLRRVLAPFTQMMDVEYNMENVEVIRSQLIDELQFVAQAFQQFVQYAHAGDYQTFIFEILGDYLYAIQQFRMQMQSGYQSYYGVYQAGFYGHGLQGFYGKSGFQGLYQDAGLYGKTGYQGLYKYGGLYGNRFYGKYQGFTKYGQDLKQFEVQMQTMIRDLYQVLQTVSWENVTVRQTWMHMIREYAQQLEVIAERLHQYVNYSAESDVYIFQQVAQNLRQYVVALEQFYSSEYSAAEWKTEFYMYVQKIAAEFEKLMYGVEQTHGTFYTLVHEVLFHYLTATYDLYMHMENIHEISQYGYGPYARQYYGDNYYGGKYYGKYFGGKYGQYYGLQGQQVYETPRELVNQIQYVASDLSATFQSGMTFNQQYAQVLPVQARHFAQIIKRVVDQLESYEHADMVIQQVIYKLREVQISFQQLAAYTVFTNVHQIKAEFDNYIQIAVAQIEKLAVIAQEETHQYYYVIKNVLQFFLYGLHDIHYQFQEVAQYGKGFGFAKYGMDKWGQQYGFAKFGKYGQQYGKGYGFVKYGMDKMGQQYGFAKYGQQYGFGKYGQEYGFDKYSHGLMSLGQYGKGYGYGYPSQYGYQHVPSTQYSQLAIRAY